jgi:hypothetical protein
MVMVVVILNVIVVVMVMKRERGYLLFVLGEVAGTHFILPP